MREITVSLHDESKMCTRVVFVDLNAICSQCECAVAKPWVIHYDGIIL